MDEQVLRPETSKCSRMEKRRLVSQSHQRQEQYGITLQQYFRDKEDQRAPPLFRINQQRRIVKPNITSNDFFQQRTKIELKYCRLKEDAQRFIPKLTLAPIFRK